LRQIRTRTKIARRLRRDATDVERILWYALGDKLAFWKFRRQHPVGRRIVDFACPEHRLAIELDGSQHMEQFDADAERTAELGRYGYRVIRFWNSDVLQNLEGVLQTIMTVLDTPTSPCPLRPRGAERVEAAH
jgi:very-short-patch-repair endonuclease